MTGLNHHRGEDEEERPLNLDENQAQVNNPVIDHGEGEAAIERPNFGHLGQGRAHAQQPAARNVNINNFNVDPDARAMYSLYYIVCEASIEFYGFFLQTYVPLAILCRGLEWWVVKEIICLAGLRAGAGVLKRLNAYLLHFYEARGVFVLTLLKYASKGIALAEIIMFITRGKGLIFSPSLAFETCVEHSLIS